MMANQSNYNPRQQLQSSFGQRNDSIPPQRLGAEATSERIGQIENAKEELYLSVSPVPGIEQWQ